MAEVKWHEFASSQPLAEALAETVANRLREAIEARGAAVIAVSGGSTPPPFFNALSRKELDWSKVTVTLVDERFVPPSSERSNARLVAHHLLQNEAAQAAFIPLYRECDEIRDAAAQANAAVSALSKIDVVVLGMGTDKHTASFFPDAGNIRDILEQEDGDSVLCVEAPSAGEPRLTLSVPRVIGAPFVALHIEGIDKKDAFNDAIAQQEGTLSPIRAVTERLGKALHVYWAPKQDKTP